MRTESIGGTPLTQLSRLAPADGADVWVKLEYANPGLSIKDRVALKMIRDAEAEGLLRPGMTIVEPSSGNTAIGLAWIGRRLGYRLIAIMQEHMSVERRNTIKAFGGEVVLVPSATTPDEAIAIGRDLAARSHGWMPNQFANPSNPSAHYRSTGPEIWSQMQGRIDAFIYATGTGGTISGVGRYLRERNSHIEIVAVEPKTSAVLSGGPPGPHRFQGMGPGYRPPNLDLEVVTRVLPVSEEDAFPLTRRLLSEECIFAGMSTGAMVHAALSLARELGPGKNVVTIAADSGFRYLSTDLFVS